MAISALPTRMFEDVSPPVPADRETDENRLKKPDQPDSEIKENPFAAMLAALSATPSKEISLPEDVASNSTTVTQDSLELAPVTEDPSQSGAPLFTFNLPNEDGSPLANLSSQLPENALPQSAAETTQPITTAPVATKVPAITKEPVELEATIDSLGDISLSDESAGLEGDLAFEPTPVDESLTTQIETAIAQTNDAARSEPPVPDAAVDQPSIDVPSEHSDVKVDPLEAASGDQWGEELDQSQQSAESQTSDGGAEQGSPQSNPFTNGIPGTVGRTAGATPVGGFGSFVNISESVAQQAANVRNQITDAVISQAKIARQGETTRLELRLDPPELGTVRVSLEHSRRGLSARLEFDESHTRQLVDQNLASLLESLENAGIALKDFSMSWNGNQETSESHSHSPFRMNSNRSASSATGVATRLSPATSDSSSSRGLDMIA